MKSLSLWENTRKREYSMWFVTKKNVYWALHLFFPFNGRWALKLWNLLWSRVYQTCCPMWIHKTDPFQSPRKSSFLQRGSDLYPTFYRWQLQFCYVTSAKCFEVFSKSKSQKPILRVGGARIWPPESGFRWSCNVLAGKVQSRCSSIRVKVRSAFSNPLKDFVHHLWTRKITRNGALSFFFFFAFWIR